MSGLAELATTAGIRLGKVGVGAMPEAAAYALFDRFADAAYLRGGDQPARLRANYARVRPELGRRELDALVAAGLRSYLRYYCEALRLQHLSRAQIDARVSVVGEGPVREQLAAGRPVVCFLGHMGNWDLAGAWCSRALGRVVTVAERLKPAEVFEEFLAFRTSLGMTIIPLTGAGDPFAALRAEATGPVMIPLLADRDLTGGGVEVDFVGHRARMAVGPAALALTTGAALHPVTIRHVRRGPWAWGIEITFHPQVLAPPAGNTRSKVVAMTQDCARALEGAVTRHTADWHMFQKVFVDQAAP